MSPLKHAPLTGMPLIIPATFVIAVQNAITKSLATGLQVAQIVFVKFTAFAIMALCIDHREVG